jgi:hypothetical protein
MTKEKIALGIAILALVVAGVAIVKGGNASFGGTTEFQKKSFVEGLFAGNSRQLEITRNGALKIGDNGATFAELKATTCNLIGTDGSQTASTTVAYDCAITGIASGDVVLAQLATTTVYVGGSAGWLITASKASTTSGYITVLLSNLTGSNRVPSASNVGSSTNVWYADI